MGLLTEERERYFKVKHMDDEEIMTEEEEEDEEYEEEEEWHPRASLCFASRAVETKGCYTDATFDTGQPEREKTMLELADESTVKRNCHIICAPSSS